jgi:hypothetical protein
VSSADADAAAELRGESRWPSALAILAAAVMHALLPRELKMGPSPWLPWIATACLILLVLMDPGRVTSLRTASRVLADVLIGLVTLANAYAAVALVQGIIQNKSFTAPTELLYAGGIVWATNVLAFALWYWDLDRGGPAERAHGSRRTPAFVFPEMLHTDHVPAGWRPVFVDYLAFAFSTATAFSPTDVSAVKPWSKLLVALEAMISLVLALLVIARAVNVIA